MPTLNVIVAAVTTFLLMVGTGFSIDRSNYYHKIGDEDRSTMFKILAVICVALLVVLAILVNL